jgi:hypothetical protein
MPRRIRGLLVDAQLIQSGHVRNRRVHCGPTCFPLPGPADANCPGVPFRCPTHPGLECGFRLDPHFPASSTICLFRFGHLRRSKKGVLETMFRRLDRMSASPEHTLGPNWSPPPSVALVKPDTQADTRVDGHRRQSATRSAQRRSAPSLDRQPAVSAPFRITLQAIRRHLTARPALSRTAAAVFRPCVRLGRIGSSVRRTELSALSW